jgi:hypothetical protein
MANKFLCSANEDSTAGRILRKSPSRSPGAIFSIVRLASRIFSTTSLRKVSLPLFRGIAGITYLFAWVISRVMYWDQGPGGFDLGEKLHYKLFLGHLDRGEGVDRRWFISARTETIFWRA